MNPIRISFRAPEPIPSLWAKLKDYWRRVVNVLKYRLHRCSHDGCWKKGRPCYLDTEEPYEWACYDHQHVLGYCSCCGQFWGGIESFEFRRNGLCDNCDYQLRADSGEFDEAEEEYD